LGASRSQHCLGALPLRFQGGGAFSQDIVKFDDAVFNGAVKTLHAIFAVYASGEGHRCDGLRRAVI